MMLHRVKLDRHNLNFAEGDRAERDTSAVLRDAGIAGGIGQFAVIQSVARSVGVDVRAINLRDGATLESSVAAFASKSE